MFEGAVKNAFPHRSHILLTARRRLPFGRIRKRSWGPMRRSRVPLQDWHAGTRFSGTLSCSLPFTWSVIREPRVGRPRLVTRHWTHSPHQWHGWGPEPILANRASRDSIA